MINKAGTLILTDIIDFLSNIPPFQFLSKPTLKVLAENLAIEFFPQDTKIISQGGAPSQYLYVIKKGGIKLYLDSDQDGITIDYLSEGDSLGFDSLYSEKEPLTNAVTIEDTICYLIDRERFFKIHNNNQIFAEYFLRSYLGKHTDMDFGLAGNRRFLFGARDGLPLTETAGDVATKRLISATPDTTIKAAAQTMAENKISSLVIIKEGGSLAGIVTDRDLRDKVVAKGKSLDNPVSSIMSHPLICIEQDEYCFEALLKMTSHNVHHLLVTDNGKPRGILTNHDIMIRQGNSPIAIAKKLEGQRSIETIIPVAAEINNIIGSLLREGSRATGIAKIITELHDILVKKIISIKTKELGPAPVPFCWIVFGSEGRKEQTFTTDQDNALIYSDLEDANNKDVSGYFRLLSEGVTDSLEKCGFPRCPAGYMADNPEWRKPLKSWKRYFNTWITTATPESILLSSIIFDFRPVFGDATLADSLREYLYDVIGNERGFLARMGTTVADNRPPMGFFRTFVVEKDGAHKDQLNLKISAISLLIDIVRLFCLEKGILATSTLERLRALKGDHEIATKYAEEIDQAFEFMMLLRMLHQLDQIDEGMKPDNFINPNKLSLIEKQTLKEIFQLISRLQDLIVQRYQLGTVS